MITPDLIMSWHPCDDYPRARVEKFWAGRPSLTPEEVWALPIPASDRLWVLIHAMPTDRERRLFAADCAERALLREREAGRDPDPRSCAVVEVARRHAVGEATDEELDAAEDAAWDATRYAARAAARDATMLAAVAAGNAAMLAARADAREAARDAAGAAAGAAAWDAECEWQGRRALLYLSGAEVPPVTLEEP